jgi:cobalt-zinc-cadmium efflux system outer membrane protein
MFKSFYYLFFFAAFAALVPLFSADAETMPQALQPGAFIDAIHANDPLIRQSRYRWEAIRERVPASGVLPDPQLSYGYFFSPIETRVGAQNQKICLSQRIPWPAKLKSQRRLAGSGVGMAYWE